MRKTKIICTIGPSVSDLEMIERLIGCGMDVARLNFSHGNHDMHREVIDRIKYARKKADKPVAILLDTKGPEIRVGKFVNGSIHVKKDQAIRIAKSEVIGDDDIFSIHPSQVLDCVQVGTQILFDDGYISSHITSIDAETITISFDNEGELKNNKGVNIPNCKLNLPNVPEKDFEDIRFGCEHGIDLIAASFVRSPEAILEIKNFLRSINSENTLVLAKIENHEGVENFDGIIQIADGVMIARGDLGVEVPISQVPNLQKMMIRKSNLSGKLSVTATQMLESMIYNPRPTRAEVSDVANAIYDGTDAVMLSGETAVGKYPTEAVNMMDQVAREAEKDFPHQLLLERHSKLKTTSVPSALTLACAKTSYNLGANSFFVFTSSGLTPRLLSRLRPFIPIVSLTPKEQTYHQMALFWGVIPVLGESFSTYAEAFTSLCKVALERKLVSLGDLVVITSGSTFGLTGTTNTMIVENIGDVLVRGRGVGKKTVYGCVYIVHNPEGVPAYSARDRILVITRCDESYLPIIEEARGVVLQNGIEDQASVDFLSNTLTALDKPGLTHTEEATQILKTGQLVTLDSEKQLIYKSIILSNNRGS